LGDRYVVVHQVPFDLEQLNSLESSAIHLLEVDGGFVARP